MENALYTTAWIKLDDIFNQLLECNAKDFSKGLRSILCFLRSQNLITSHTFRNIADTLCLEKEWKSIEINAEGQYLFRVGNRIIDTFDIPDITIYVLQELANDEIIKEKNASGSWTEFKQVLEVTIPSDWNEFYQSIAKIKNPFFTRENIFWIAPNSRGAFAIYRIPYSTNFSQKVDTRQIKKVFDGVEPNCLIYIPDTDRLYAKIYGMDAYLSYNTVSNEHEIVYQAQLLGVGKKTEYYIDRDGVLSSYTQGEVTIYDMVTKESEITVNYNGTITVMPPKQSIKDFAPYILDQYGQKTVCSVSFTEKFLWKHIIQATCKKIFLNQKKGFSQIVASQIFFQIPCPFSVIQIVENLNHLCEKGICAKRKVLSMIRLLNNFCVKNKILVNETLSYYFYEELAELLSNITTQKERLHSFLPEENGKIGQFLLTKNGELITDFDDIYNGKICGENIIKENYKRYPGEIYFNRSTSKYMMKYNGRLVPYFPYVEELEDKAGILCLVREEGENNTQVMFDKVINEAFYEA